MSRRKVWLSTMDNTQKGPSYNSSAAMYPEKSPRAQLRYSRPTRSAPFFPRRLDPVLDGSKGYEYAMVSPKVPGSSPVGQSVLHHRSYRRGHDPLGILGARWGKVGHVRVEVDITVFAAVFGIDDLNIPRPPGSQIAQIMKRPASSAVAVTTLTALGAAPTPVVARTMLDDRLGQLAWIGNTLGAIGNIFSRFHNSAFLPPQQGDRQSWTIILTKSRLLYYSLENCVNILISGKIPVCCLNNIFDAHRIKSGLLQNR